MVVVDTSVIIDHLRQRSSDSHLVSLVQKKGDETFAISVISIQELYEGKSTREENEEGILLEMVNAMQILPYTFEIAELAGKIARDFKQPLEFADSVIAATSIVNGAKLSTLNKQDFKSIPDLEFV